MLINRHAPILVTGSAGRIGQFVVAGLQAAGWHVRGFDCRPTPHLKDSVVGDLQDPQALTLAALNIGALIHLGGVPDDDDFLSRLLPNNIVGAYQVLEAARRAKIPRIILASSGQVQWWQILNGPYPLRTHDPYAPRHWYAVGKIFLESAGQAYAQSYGMTVLALRLGWSPRTRAHLNEVANTPQGPDTYLSPGDIRRFFVRAIEAPLDPGFAALFVASRPVKQAVFDLEPTKRLLAWEPLDQYPTGADEGLD